MLVFSIYEIERSKKGRISDNTGLEKNAIEVLRILKIGFKVAENVVESRRIRMILIHGACAWTKIGAKKMVHAHERIRSIRLLEKRTFVGHFSFENRKKKTRKWTQHIVALNLHSA